MHGIYIVKELGSSTKKGSKVVLPDLKVLRCLNPLLELASGELIFPC